MDMPCSCGHGKYTLISPVPPWSEGSGPLSSPMAAVTSGYLHSAWPIPGRCKSYPQMGFAFCPRLQSPPNFDTLVETSLSKDSRVRNKPPKALIHFSKPKSCPFPLQLLLVNKGIKRDRNVFAQSWGKCISFTAMKLSSWISETVVDVQAGSLACKRNRETKWENYFPKPSKL